MIPTDRLDWLDALIERGDLLRGQWTDGRERACLLAALSPEAAAAGSAKRCPATLMPAWLAHLTPWLDDEPSAEAWPAIVRRYASLARRWHVLDAAAWERARVGACVAIVVEARSHVDASEAQALAAIDAVLAWLRAGAPEAQREPTWRAASALAASALAASEASAWAAWAAEATEAEATEAATWASAWAAWAAWAAEATEAEATEAAARAAARAAATRAASSATADRIASGVLDAIQREVEAWPRT
jgi:hypothetical protein